MLALIPFSAIVGVATLAYNYKTSDAEELRTLPPPHDFLGHSIGAYCP